MLIVTEENEKRKSKKREWAVLSKNSHCCSQLVRHFVQLLL